MDTLLIFDLDQTLIDPAGSGRRAVEAAFRECWGLTHATQGVQLAGHTDPAIFAEVAQAHGRPSDDASLAPVRMRYLALLRDEVARNPGQVLPGVVPLLQACQRHGLALALGTGNVEAGARIKLAPHGLNPYFPVGGFGDDAAERPALLRAAVSKAGRHYGKSFARIVVIGDTPRDIAAGHAIGAEVLAVATGHFDAAALDAAGADHVVENLAADTVLPWLVGGGRHGTG